MHMFSLRLYLCFTWKSEDSVTLRIFKYVAISTTIRRGSVENSANLHCT